VRHATPNTPDNAIKNDPMAAIYALSLGDFGVDSLMTDDLKAKLNAQRAKRPSNKATNTLVLPQTNNGLQPQQLHNQLSELVDIYSIDKTMALLGFEADQGYVLFDSVAASLAEMFRADACHLLQINQQPSGKQSLAVSGSSLVGLHGTDHGRELTVPLHPHPASNLNSGAQTCWDAWLSLPEAVGLNHTPKKPLPTLDLFTPYRPNQQHPKALLVAPLKLGQKQLGLLVLEQWTSTSFDGPQLRLATHAGQLFVASLNLQQWIGQAQHHLSGWGAQASPVGDRRGGERHLNELQSLRAQLTESIADLGQCQHAFVEALAGLMDSRYPFMQGHSQRVANTAKQVAQAMGLCDKTTELVYYAGLLSTLGKLRLPANLLNKQTHLTQAEWQLLQQYPNMGVELLLQIHFLSDVIPLVHSQAERWNGSGGPQGLSGEAIPLGARIIAVADAYHAMRHDRPYRKHKALHHRQAMAVLNNEASIKWDPNVVAALAGVL
jgi:HD-GYP domain-containing protein (c-di-GMP phosphodiesterase class II)